MSPVFSTEPQPNYGAIEQVSPMVQRLIAKNPSKFTYHGTGTYLVSKPKSEEVVIIDPGPNDTDHISALVAAIGNRSVSHLLITHTHLDHSPATASLVEITGAPTYGFGPHPLDTTDSNQKKDLDINKNKNSPNPNDSEEGGDLSFEPMVELRDGDIIAGDGITFEVLHTPGHISNHLCFALEEEQTLFTGDHVMGWSTTVIPAPNGNLSHYLKNLGRLLERSESLYRPTHGPPLKNPHPYVASLIDHRKKREAQIIEALNSGPRTIDSLVSEIYAQIDKELHRAASTSVYAHLLDLARNEKVQAEPELNLSSQWRLS